MLIFRSVCRLCGMPTGPWFFWQEQHGTSAVPGWISKKYFTWICLTQGRSKNRWRMVEDSGPKLNYIYLLGKSITRRHKIIHPGWFIKSVLKNFHQIWHVLFSKRTTYIQWGFLDSRGSHCVMNFWITTRPPSRQPKSKHKQHHPETSPGFSRWSTNIPLIHGFPACRCVTGCKLRFMMPAVIKRHASKVIKLGFTVLDIPTAS